MQTEQDAEQGESFYCYTHLAPILQEEQEVWVYNTELIDLNDYDLPKHFKIEQKYYIICKAYPVDKKRVAKIKTERL